MCILYTVRVDDERVCCVLCVAKLILERVFVDVLSPQAYIKLRPAGSQCAGTARSCNDRETRCKCV